MQNIERCKELIKPLARKYHLKLVLLFGSQTTSSQHQESDVDIAYFPTKKINEAKWYEELMNALGRADLDLVNIKDTYNHVLLFEIFSHGVVLYEAHEGLKSSLEWQSFIDYVDFKPYLEVRSHLLDKKILALLEQ